MLLHILLLLILVNVYSLTIEYYPSDIPSPNDDPKTCNRPNVKRSSICDMNNMITEESKNVIEGYINSINTNNAQIAIAIIKKMKTDFIKSFSDGIDKAAKNFAESLHNKWGVGTADTNNGILIFISIDDRVVYISTGRGVKSKMKNYLIDNIIEKMRPYLRAKDYGSSIELSIIHIDSILTDGKSSITSPKFDVDIHQNPDIQSFVFLTLFTVGLISIVYWNHQRTKKLERGEKALQSLMKEVNNARNGTDEKQYQSISCPICLEDFPVTDDNIEANDDSKDVRRPMALQCGHVFCYTCLEHFLKTSGKRHCAICRAPADVDEPKKQSLPQTNRRNNNSHDNTSCSQTFNSHATVNETVFVRRIPELRFRASSMHSLYPNVVTQGVLRNLNNAFENQNPDLVTSVINQRVATVTETIRSNREGYSTSGSFGSNRSFGGGGSFGGRGGRW